MLHYEAVQIFLMRLPGALGFVMRRFFYRYWLGRVGRNVTFGVDVTIRHPHKIRIGDNVVIDDHCLLDAKGTDNNGIEIGSHVLLGRNSILQCKNGDIIIGDHVNIGVNCDIATANRIVIGKGTLIAAYSHLVGGGHEFACADVPIMEQERFARDINIGPDTWIGTHVVVNDGTEIGEGAIVGAGAVVLQSIPERAIVGGVPARVIRIRQTERDKVPSNGCAL